MQHCPGLLAYNNKAGYTATPVACGWAGAVMRKPLANQKSDVPTRPELYSIFVNYTIPIQYFQVLGQYNTITIQYNIHLNCKQYIIIAYNIIQYQ